MYIFQQNRHLTGESAQEFGDNFLEFSVCGIGNLTIGCDLFKHCLFVGLNVLQVFLFEFGDLGWVHFVQVTTDTAVNDGNLSNE